MFPILSLISKDVRKYIVYGGLFILLTIGIVTYFKIWLHNHDNQIRRTVKMEVELEYRNAFEQQRLDYNKVVKSLEKTYENELISLKKTTNNLKNKNLKLKENIIYRNITKDDDAPDILKDVFRNLQ